VRLVTRKPIVADAEEVTRNVRARSAKMRVCEKLPPPC
jgi:16S rRNA (cytosine1402-N4)-methyltransferase